MSQELFNTAFRKGQFGYATAMGVVLAVVTLLFAAIVFDDQPVHQRRWREGLRR